MTQPRTLKTDVLVAEILLADVLKETLNILSAHPDPVKAALAAAEAEQLVIAAVRSGTRNAPAQIDEGQAPALVDRPKSAETLYSSDIRSLANLRTRADLLTHLQFTVPRRIHQRAVKLARQRIQNIPLQHLTGYQFFYEHEYIVDANVLIPRPETEVLIDTAIRELTENQIDPMLGMEIGLGSGILSVELLARFLQLTMWSSEVSAEAKQIAVRNAREILPDSDVRLKIVMATEIHEIFEPFEKKLAHTPVDFIISNPPYLVLANQAQELDPEVFTHEPHQALFAPIADPLYFYRKTALEGLNFLAPQGFVFMEIPHERSSAIQALFVPGLWRVKVLTDLNGRDRVLVARRCP